MRAKFIRTSLLIVTLLSLCACSAVEYLFVEEVEEELPTPLVEFQEEFQTKVIWSAQVGEGAGENPHEMSPWIQNNRIFAIDYEGEVFAFDLVSGKKLWQKDLDLAVVTGVGGGADKIYIGSENGLVIALNEVDGKELWRQSMTSEVLAPASGDDKVVAVRTSDGRVSGLDVTSGNILWSYQRAVPLLSLRGASRPLVYGDKVIAGYDNGKLVALSITDGSVIWERAVAVPRGRTELDRLVDIDADPVIINDRVYVVTFHGNVVALDVETGGIIWTREMSSQSGLAVDYGQAVFVTDEDSYIWAIQDRAGDALWRQTRLLRRRASPPNVIQNTVVVGDLEGYVHFISQDDGRFVSRTKVSDAAIMVKPLINENIIYTFDVEGSLNAIRVP